MKKIIGTIAVSLVLTGCSSFLERTSQNQIVPTTVDQYKEMLQGTEGYFYYAPSRCAFVNLMTDDISYFDVSTPGTSNGVESSSLTSYRLVYQWADEIENEYFTDNAFDYLYSQVLVANTILNDIDHLEDNTGERELLRGQALFHRAFGYFQLANLYAQAYNESSEDDPCVPLKLDPTPSTENYPKSTIGAVWGQIRQDIDEGLECLEQYKVTNIYELNYSAMLVLAVRAALQMEDYDAVITYGEMLLEENSSLFDITMKEDALSKDATAIGDSKLANFISAENPEIVWLFGTRSGTFTSLLGGISENHVYYYSISDSLTDTFSMDLKDGETDRRLNYFFVRPGIIISIASTMYNYTPLKYDYQDGYYRSQAFRTGEVYISLAEAYARKDSPDYDKALEYLNALRRNRISGYTDRTLADAGGAEGIVDFIWRERRRELCCEELHRWWDLRRTGQPEIEHAWRENDRYILQEHDPAYVLNYPEAEREINPANYNERPYRQAVTE